MNMVNERTTAVGQSIRGFIIESFLFGEDTGFTEEASFLENGVIDSMGFLELISYLEDTYNISIEDHELIPDNMDSLANVTSFVIRKLDAAS